MNESYLLLIGCLIFIIAIRDTGIAFILILSILCLGDPDILDGIIKYINK